jgi:hypothetical protein
MGLLLLFNSLPFFDYATYTPQSASEVEVQCVYGNVSSESGFRQAKLSFVPGEPAASVQFYSVRISRTTVCTQQQPQPQQYHLRYDEDYLNANGPVVAESLVEALVQRYPPGQSVTAWYYRGHCSWLRGTVPTLDSQCLAYTPIDTALFYDPVLYWTIKSTAACTAFLVAILLLLLYKYRARVREFLRMRGRLSVDDGTV